MESYRILLYLHIVGAVLVIGVTFTYPFLQSFAERRGVAATRFALQFMRRMENFVVLPGAVLIALFGVGLIFEDRTGYSDDFPTWLGIAVTWFAAAIVLAQTVQRRIISQAISTLEGLPDTEHLPDPYLAIGSRLQMVSGLFGLSVLGIAFMMVWGAEGGF